MKAIASRYRTELGLLLAVLAVLAVTIFYGSGYDTPARAAENFQTLALTTSLLGICALGAAVVIVSGGIDLSAGSMIAFSATVFACVCLATGPEPGSVELLDPAGEVRLNSAGEPLMNRSRTDVLSAGSYATAAGVTLVAALAVGTLHAWLIASVGLPPFVATLASLVGLRSVAKLLISQVTRAVEDSSSSQISIRHEAFEVLKGWEFVTGVFLTLAAGLWFLLSRTVAGRHLYAVGGNEEAARLSGVRVDRTKWLAYCISSVTAAIAGIIYCSYVSVAKPDQLAIGYELNAIAAAVVGGCSLAGGAGTVVGVAFGALFLRAVIDAIAKIVKSGAVEVEGLIVGLLVIGAATISEASSAEGSRRTLFTGPLGWAAAVSLVAAVTLTASLVAAQTSLQTGAVAGTAVAAVCLVRAVAEHRR